MQQQQLVERCSISKYTYGYSSEMAAPKRRVVPSPVYGGPSVFRAKYTLDAAQCTILEELRARLSSISNADLLYCDDAMLCRYLRARDWNVANAEKLLRETLAWRTEFAIHSLHPQTIAAEFESGKIYNHGFDRNHRPVMYQRPRRQNTTDHKKQVSAVAYLLDRQISAMSLDKGVEQHVLFIDFKDYSIFNAPPMSVTKEVMSILMDRFPERLGVLATLPFFPTNAIRFVILIKPLPSLLSWSMLRCSLQ